MNTKLKILQKSSSWLLLLFMLCCLNLQAQQTLALARTSNNTTNSTGRAPQGSRLCNRSVYLITQSEMQASGFNAGDIISEIGFNYSSAQDIETTSTSFGLYFENSTDSDNLKSNTWDDAIIGMTQVRNTNITIPAATGIFTIPFSGATIFTYNGGSVYVAFDYQNLGSRSTNNSVSCNNSTSGSIKTYSSSTSIGSSMGNSSFRPETYFTKGCTIVNPIFFGVSPICSGGTLWPLPTTSINGISGTWSPPLNNTATTNYIFTPTAGTCATTASMTITVNPKDTPTFTQVSTITAGGSLAALPTTSKNGLTGTWSPALNNTTTTTYTFTPTAGQCANSTTMTIAVLQPASSLNFSSSSNTVNLGQTLGNFGTGDFAIEMKAKTSGSPYGHTYLLDKRSFCDRDNLLEIGITPEGSIFVQTYNFQFSFNEVTGSVIVNDDSWHHIAVSRTAGYLKIYVDGALDQTSATNTAVDLNNNYNLVLGGNTPCTPYGGNQLFSGNLDEVRFWNRSLTQTEIQTNMNCEIQTTGDGLLANYHFNQGNTNTNNSSVAMLTDSSGNNNNGTLLNFGLTGANSNWSSDAGVVSGVACSNLVQYTAIPDANFEQALFDLGIDTVNGDNQVLTSAITSITTLDVSAKNIADLTGIKGFTSLTELMCYSNQLITLDVSNMTALSTLYCSYNHLTNINVSGVVSLITLGCHVNQLTTLELGGSTSLATLYCQNNLLGSLNLSGLSALNYVACNFNQINTLDCSVIPQLMELHCDENPSLVALNLSGLSNSASVDCRNNISLSCITTSNPNIAAFNPYWLKDANARYSTNCNIPSAPMVDAQTFCAGATVANLVAFGTDLKWYATETDGIILTDSTVLETNMYYVSQTINGFESLRVGTTITVNPMVTPIFNQVPVICYGENLSSLPTTSNEGITGTWFPVINNLATTTYTFTPDAGKCASTAEMTITVNSTPAPTGLGNQRYSGLATLANLSVIGTSLQWYDSASGGTALLVSTTLVDGTTYYASQTVNSCESSRTAVTVKVNDIPPGLSFCKGTKVATAVGTSTLKFYLYITGSSALAASTLLTTRTYFVTQLVNGIESTPRVPVAVTINALPGTIATITASDTVLCKYMGTTNTVTYTATPALGATSYIWTVPTGVTIINQGNNTLTVDFHDATPSGTGVIGNIGVRAFNEHGCVSATARTIALSTKLPTVPSKVALTYNGVAQTKVGHFVGDATKTLVLEATDNSNTANRYTWELPAGVSVVSGDATADRIISIHLGGVAPGNTDLVFKVSSVAGCGTSAARSVAVTRSAPGSPRALVLTDDAISSVNPIIIVSGYTGKFKTTPLTLTATPRTGTGIEATSYKWVLPSGIGIVDASATFVSENSGFKTYTSTANAIKINLSGVGTATSLLLNVFGVNGNGESLLSRDLTLTSAIPARPGTLTSASGGTATYHPTCGTITVRIPNVFGVTYTWSVKGGAMATIPSTNSNGNEATINVSQLPTIVNFSFRIGVVASNGTGSSSETIYTIRLGSACSVGKFKANDDNAAKVTNEFKVIAYPNPSSNVFTIKIQSLDEAKTELSVYDTAGRLVEKLQAQANEVDLGSKYPAGAYNVIVKQGANSKAVRVIKK